MTQGTGTTVELSTLCFSPTILTIQPGETVTWINRDDFQHNIGGNYAIFDGIHILNAGQSFSRTFPAAGIYPYSCSLHFGMNGAIVVSGAASLPVAHVALAAGAATTNQPGGGSLVLALLLAALAGITGYAFGRLRLRPRPSSSS
jgi:hypothetical protein